MEAAIPNLLIRTVTDSIDSPLSHGQPREISSDHDYSSPSSAVSFRKAGGGGGNGGGGGPGSPLSQSPRSLHLEVKERKENSPGSMKSKPFVDWVEEEKRKDAEGDDRDRVLSLGNWNNTGFDVDKDEVVDDGDLDQVFEFDADEKVGNADFGLGAAGAGAAVGVSQG